MEDYTAQVKKLVDDIKGISANAGLGGEAGEYNLVTEAFLYKFLNDKFLYEAQQVDSSNTVNRLVEMSDEEYEMLLLRIGTNSAKLYPRHLIENLYNQQNESDFAKTLDDTLNDISVLNNDIYSVHTAGDSDIRLFDERLIVDLVRDASQRNTVAKNLISKLASVKFNDGLFSQGFDFFSTIFEYMIKDYNKDGGGKYAEYYTPHFVAKIMADILVGKADFRNVRAYDPSAGSGTLLMNVASKIGIDKVSIYSQDISQKSSNLLRLNLILNGLSHSINNIVQGNTIVDNRHTEKMDFIVSNPPFKLDFSEWRDDVQTLPEYTECFFAGVPNIPAKAKDKMAIYLLFLQHIIYQLSETGRAAIVVPTGFITAQGTIEKKIRKKLVENKWLKGVVSMPSNIFATTGTNVSVIFIDKSNGDDVVLVDATNLGKQIKDSGNQRTVLSQEDEQNIIDAFHQKQSIDEFSVVVPNEKIIKKNFSLSANQYFDIKVEFETISTEDFQKTVQDDVTKISAMISEATEINSDILKSLKKLELMDWKW